MNKLLLFLADMLYPNRCPICGGLIKWDMFICTECEENIKADRADACRGCGKEQCICGKLPYDGAVAMFDYGGTAKRGVYSLKDGSKEFGRYLGEKLGREVKDKLGESFDLIVPVPMSKERLMERGYNQAEVMAEKISEVTGVSLKNGILYKSVSAVQHTLDKRQRQENVSAFGINECDLGGMNILLCDDVLTTGSTIGKCAELLKSKGAAKVYAAVGTTTKLKKRD